MCKNYPATDAVCCRLPRRTCLFPRRVSRPCLFIASSPGDVILSVRHSRLHFSGTDVRTPVLFSSSPFGLAVHCLARLLVRSFGSLGRNNTTTTHPRGQRALVAIANGVLQTVVRQSLPEVDPVAFHDLVDGGEGKEEGESPRKLSSTPLRMCRYAGGADGVAFGEPRGVEKCEFDFDFLGLAQTTDGSPCVVFFVRGRGMGAWWLVLEERRRPPQPVRGFCLRVGDFVCDTRVIFRHGRPARTQTALARDTE